MTLNPDRTCIHQFFPGESRICRPGKVFDQAIKPERAKRPSCVVKQSLPGNPECYFPPDDLRGITEEDCPVVLEDQGQITWEEMNARIQNLPPMLRSTK